MQRLSIEQRAANILDSIQTEEPAEQTATEQTKAKPWPADLDEAAYHGLAGEFVRAIDPHTEADNAAVLVQTLVCFGQLVGRGPHIKVEGDEHHANLNALIVGDSSKARKGTSYGRVKQPFEAIPDAPDGKKWSKVVHGLSSGEGLKWEVRDPIEKSEMEGGTRVTKVVDPGVEDKRLLVVEAEFAQVLRQCARAGNTLSPTIRCAWDGSTLQSLTKNDPVTAKNHHISIIGHIVASELRQELTQTDAANGFANRFLFVCAKRSKLLPFGGGDMPPDLISRFAKRFGDAAHKARSRRQALQMSDVAREVWAEIYEDLSEGKDGLYGAVTARAEAQCLRLALIYALLDEAEEIGSEHLTAAVAVWKRCDASAAVIFGSSVGDSRADQIHNALQKAPNGLARTQISGLFSRHETTERINAALKLLQDKGMAYSETLNTGGAPKEVWKAGTAKQANKAKEAPQQPDSRRRAAA